MNISICRTDNLGEMANLTRQSTLILFDMGYGIVTIAAFSHE